MAITAQNINQESGYKQTEVGVIPEDWEVKRLEELGAWKGGGTPSMANASFWINGTTYWASSGDIKTKVLSKTASMITEIAVKQSSTALLQEGAILIVTRSGILRKYLPVAKNSVLIAINQDIKALMPNSQVSADYLLQVLSARGPDILSTCMKTGTTVESVEYTWLKKYQNPLPSPPEPHAIATALSDVDSLITSLDQLIAKKRDIKQATMQQLLTGKTRLREFSRKPKSACKQTEVGAIPEDWEVKSIGHVITEFRGGAPLTPNDFIRDGVGVLPKGGVVRGGRLRIEETEQQYCSQKYAEAHKSNQVNNLYTIVVLRDLVPSGPSIGLMVKFEDSDSFVLAQGVYGFKVSLDKANSEYLIQFSNGSDYRKLMNSIMVGSTQVHITNTAFKKVLLPFPPLPEQQAIATVLSDMDAEIAALEQRRDKTRALKQGMMQELLTGKTRLL